MRYLRLLVMVGMLAACGTGDEDANSATDSRQDLLTKSQAREQLGQGALDYDPCERYGWYGDGECDDFCPNPDPDCAATISGCVTHADCTVGGCSGQLCGSVNDELISTCEYLPEYACYDQEYTECGCFDGQCGWQQTAALKSCLDEARQSDPAPPEPPPSAECQQDTDCQVGGCSGQLCGVLDDDLISTCEYLPEYACYGQQYTQCGCYAGTCGWKQTEELAACLAQGGPDPESACPAPRVSEEACVQVIAYAVNPASDQCCEYPTPCAAPEGWTIQYEGCPL
jgi:eight-cysteine-cluster-containing protein